MPIQYKRQNTNRGNYINENLRVVKEAVGNGASVNGASKKYGVPKNGWKNDQE